MGKGWKGEEKCFLLLFKQPYSFTINFFPLGFRYLILAVVIFLLNLVQHELQGGDPFLFDRE